MNDTSFLKQYDQGYVPAEKQFQQMPNVSSLTDGDYVMEVTFAAMRKTPKEHEDVFTMHLRVLTPGDSRLVIVEHTYFFRRAESINYLGTDLDILGMGAKEWTAAHGKEFSIEFAKCLDEGRLRGVCFSGKKVTLPPKQAGGKPIHNLYVNYKCPRPGNAPPMPEDDGEVPF